MVQLSDKYVKQPNHMLIWWNSFCGSNLLDRAFWHHLPKTADILSIFLRRSFRFLSNCKKRWYVTKKYRKVPPEFPLFFYYPAFRCRISILYPRLWLFLDFDWVLWRKDALRKSKNGPKKRSATKVEKIVQGFFRSPTKSDSLLKRSLYKDTGVKVAFRVRYSA